eukprot:GGOE01029556.1.p2 GENE.GGOE01029556.1~~GGOE01029556.1.p2  ORF type:complete len:261 (-),score=64.87 GGOE01029556.1:288-1070(-)
MPAARDAMGGLAEVSAALYCNAERRRLLQQARAKASAAEELQVRQVEKELHERRAAAAALRERMGRHDRQQKLKAEKQDEWRFTHRMEGLARSAAAKQTRSQLEAHRRAELLEAEAQSEGVSRRFLLGKLEEYADRLERRTESCKNALLRPPSAAVFRPTTGPGQTEWLQGISPRWRPPLPYKEPPPSTTFPVHARNKTRLKAPSEKLEPERTPPISIPAAPLVLTTPLSSREDPLEVTGESGLAVSWPPRQAPAFRIPS